MVDIWMIYSLLIPFVEVLLQVVLDHIRTKEGGNTGGGRTHVGVGRRRTDRVDSLIKIILPGVIAAFQITFWSFAASNNYVDFQASHGQC